MKLTATIIAACMATASAFAPKGTQVSSTELYNYAPTKWSPRGGSNGYAPSGGASYAPSAPAAPASGPVSSGPPKSYSVTKWSPKGGAVPYGGSSNGMAASAPVAAAPAPAPAAPAGPTMADLAAQWAAMNKSAD